MQDFANVRRLTSKIFADFCAITPSRYPSAFCLNAFLKINKSHNPTAPFPNPWSWLLLLVLPFSACNVTKHLDKGKRSGFWLGNSLRVKTEKNMTLNARTKLNYELSPLYRQKPNTRTLGFLTPDFGCIINM